MTKRCLFPLLMLLHFLAEGQVHSVKLLNADTTVCSGSTVRLQSTFSIGSFQYIGTYGGKDYFLDTVSRSWTEARAEAVSKGMELWMIDNLAENNAVYDLIPIRTRVNTYFWIGLKQDQTSETAGEYGAGWKWVDDRTLDATFKYWLADEPDNKFLDKTEAGFASLGLLPSGSKWSDMTDLVPSGYQAYAIAEMNSSPIRIDWYPTGVVNKDFIEIKPTVTKDYKVEITYRGVQKESNQVKVTVVEAKVKPSFEVDPTSINCLSKNTFNFINTSEAADPSLTTYRWDFGDGNIATGFQVTHQYSGVQSYTVRLTASDQLGCSSSFTNTLSVLSSPLKPVVSMLSGSAKFCNGDSVILSTVVQQPDPKVSFNWYRNNSFLKTTKTITVGTAGDYFLEAVNQNGCKDTALIQLATFPLPPTPLLRVAEGYSASFCQGDSTYLEAVAATNTGTYKWAAFQSSGYVGIADASTAFLTVKKPVDMEDAPFSMKYRVLYVDENNCSSNWSDPLEVVSLPAPTVSISYNGSSTTICEGSTVLLTASSAATLGRYIWTRDGITLQDGLDAFWLAKETGVYQLRATNSYSCESISNKIDILVNKLPASPVIQPSANIPEIVSQQEVRICAGSSGTLRVSSFSGAVYQWFRDGVLVNGANKDSLVVNTAGKYRVSTTLVGCSSLSQEMTVGLLPLPNGIMVEPEFPAICFGADRVLNATGAAGYQWYYNYVPIKGATDSAYRALVPGVYQVEFLSNKGCKKISSNFINLNLIRKPTPRFSVDIYCTGSEANFTNLSQTANSGSVNYLWSFQNGQKDSGYNAKHIFTSSGLYKVCLEVIPVACPNLKDSTVLNIQIEAAPPGVRYPAINAMVGKSISLVARPIGDFYEWKPDAGLNSPYIRIPVLNTPPKEQRFTVDITTRSGCRTVDTQMVRVFDEQQIYVAGGFTPNNDGNNDKVYPILVGVAAFRYIKIFNRWGVQVFQTASTDPDQGWDGTYKGVPQPADTYTWVISAVGDNEREIRKSGSLVLIR